MRRRGADSPRPASPILPPPPGPPPRPRPDPRAPDRIATSHERPLLGPGRVRSITARAVYDLRRRSPVTISSGFPSVGVRATPAEVSADLDEDAQGDDADRPDERGEDGEPVEV